MMKIGVLMKTVEFVYAQTGTEIGKNFVCADDIVAMVNPLDETALEYALEIKDRQPDVTVVALTLGDGFAEEGLRKGLAMGADRAVHIHCEEYDCLDAFASSAALARACERERFDLILCGAVAIDDNGGLEGPYVAERLGIPHVSGVVKISVRGGGRPLEVERVVERSDRQVLECVMPALLTVRKGTTLPRYPTLAGVLRARESAITVVEPEALGFDKKTPLSSLVLTRTVGLSGPKPKKNRMAQQAARLSAAERVNAMLQGGSSRERAGGRTVEGGSAEMFDRLESILATAGILKQ
jgi:electron transfer flavoprotein beta subunit